MKNLIPTFRSILALAFLLFSVVSMAQMTKQEKLDIEKKTLDIEKKKLDTKKRTSNPAMYENYKATNKPGNNDLKGTKTSTSNLVGKKKAVSEGPLTKKSVKGKLTEEVVDPGKTLKSKKEPKKKRIKKPKEEDK